MIFNKLLGSRVEEHSPECITIVEFLWIAIQFLSFHFNFLWGVDMPNSIQIHTHEVKGTQFFNSELCPTLVNALYNKILKGKYKFSHHFPPPISFLTTTLPWFPSIWFNTNDWMLFPSSQNGPCQKQRWRRRTVGYRC